MTHPRFVAAAIAFALSTFVLAADEPGRDVLYQVSTLGALQEGVYDGVADMKELRKHGDFGIGTFEALDGEMAVLDGRIYQVRSDGKVYEVPDTVKTPFAAITFFETDQKADLDQPLNLAQLEERIQGMLPTRNIPYAVKVAGHFTYVKTRSVPRQQKPYPRLIEVTRNQPTFEMENVHGTIVGYWLPQYLAGVNMAGYHFHFLTDDRQAGGHLLEIRMVRGAVEIDYTYGLNLVLPAQNDFYRTDLATDKREELEEIEK